jgi:hypothetical protein
VTTPHRHKHCCSTSAVKIRNSNSLSCAGARHKHVVQVKVTHSPHASSASCSCQLECTTVQFQRGHAFDCLRNIENVVARYSTAKSDPFHMLTQHGQLPGQLPQLPQLPLVAESASSASMHLPQSVSAAFLQQYQGSCSTNVLI